MSDPTDGRWRSVRSGAFVLIAAQIAAVGHIAGGGTPPDLPLLAAMSAVLMVALRSVATARRRFPVLLAAMAGTQLVFHAVLTLTDAHHATAHHDDPVRMLVFHALAALVSASLLGHGERLLFAIHRWLVRHRPVLPAVRVVGTVPGWTPVVERGGRPWRPRVAAAAVSRRGPPAEPAPSC